MTIRGGNAPRLVAGMATWFRAFGIELQSCGADLRVAAPERLQVRPEFLPLAGRDLPKLAVRPWPGFPVDVLPVMVTLACKSHGAILFQNWMYEHGLSFVHQLNQLGADIEVLDSQRVVVPEAPARFGGGEVMPPEVIQSVKALFLAALADPAETVIHGTDILRRRYPDIMTVYRSLGAQIEKVGARNGHRRNGHALSAAGLPMDAGAPELPGAAGEGAV